MIRIFSHSYLPYLKWRCTSSSQCTLKSKLLPFRSNDVGAISSANHETSGWVRQDTWQNSKTINTTRGGYASFSATKSISFSIASPCRCWMRIGSISLLCRRECYATCPRPNLFIQFSRKYFSRNRSFPLAQEKYTGADAGLFEGGAKSKRKNRA